MGLRGDPGCAILRPHCLARASFDVRHVVRHWETGMTYRRERTQRVWWILALLALAVRVPFLLQAQVLMTEGTTYVTLARNLLAGRGYVGILGETELVMVSAFPHLIAGLGWVLGDLVWAGRLISLLSGALLVVPVYLLGRDLFGEQAGRWAGLLVALHPLLVSYAPLVRVETPFMLAWLFGICATWKAMRSGPGSAWVWGVPIAFGGAYLLKTEGAVYFALSMALLFVTWVGSVPWRRWLPVLIVQSLIFLLLAAPMVGWLSAQTGRLTPDTKGIVNYAIASRIMRGMDYQEAAYGLGPGGSPAGPLLDRNRLVRVAGTSRGLRLDDPAYRRGMIEVLRKELSLLRWPVLSPLWLLFAILGVVAALARGEWRAGLFPAYYLLPALLGVATILFVWTRYLFPVIPLVALWAGNGVAVLADVVTMGFVLRRPAIVRLQNTLGVLLTLMLVLSMPYTRVVLTHLRQVPDQEQQEAGIWLAQEDPSPEKRIMSKTSQVPYYAKGVHVPMPDADPAGILTYAQIRGVDYAVVSEAKDSERSYRVWLDPARAPEGWEAVYQGGDEGRRIVIYRLPSLGCECEQEGAAAGQGQRSP